MLDHEPDRTEAAGRTADGRRFAVSLALITLAGLAVRVGVIWWRRGTPVGGDGADYLATARLLADGHGYVSMFDPTQPIAHHPPAWVTVLAAAPFAGVDSRFGMQLYAAALAALGVLVVGLAGREIAGRSAGLLAAGVAALYPGFWVYSTNLLSETLLPAVVGAILLLAYRYRQAPTTPRLVALAVAVAVGMLTRAELSLYFVLLLVPLVLTSPARPVRARLAQIGLAAAVCILLVAPWSAYNLGRFDDPVALSSGLGPAMAVGACDATFHGDALGSQDLRCSVVVHLQHPADDRSEQDLRMRRAAVRYTLDHLDRLPAVLYAREGRTWSFYRPGAQIHFDHGWNHAAIVALWGQLVAYWLLVPFAIAGAVVLRRRGTVVWPLLVPVAVAVLVAGVTFGEPRYRSGAEVSMVIMTAVAIDAGWRRLRRPGPQLDAVSPTPEESDPVVPDPSDRR